MFLLLIARTAETAGAVGLAHPRATDRKKDPAAVNMTKRREDEGEGRGWAAT